jgi:hypothetical protein
MCLVLVGLYRLAPKVLGALKIAQPETIVGMAPVLEPIGAGNYDRARAATDPRGSSSAHSGDERCQPPVGGTTDSRRTTQGRH